MKKSDVLGIFLSVLFVGCIFGYVGYENYLEKQELIAIEKAKREYDAFVESETSVLFYERIVPVYDYYKRIDENNLVDRDLRDLKDYIEDDINFYIEKVLEMEGYYEEDLDNIAAVTEEDFIKESIKEEIAEVKRLYKLYNKAMVNKTEEEIAEIDEVTRTDIRLDMSGEEVLNRIGKPNDSTKNTNPLGVFEMWYYDEKIIYLENNKVYQIVNI